METDCVICALAAKSIQVWTVYEDDVTFAFLPKKMQVVGHTVVAPKRHFGDIYSTPEHDLHSLLDTVKKIAIHYRNKLGAKGCNILNANHATAQQSVPHLHFHILPRFENDGVDAWPNLPCPSCDKEEFIAKARLQK